MVIFEHFTLPDNEEGVASKFALTTHCRLCWKGWFKIVRHHTTPHVVDTLWTQGRVAGQLANTGWLRFVASTSSTGGATDVNVGLQ